MPSSPSFSTSVLESLGHPKNETDRTENRKRCTHVKETELFIFNFILIGLLNI